MTARRSIAVRLVAVIGIVLGAAAIVLGLSAWRYSGLAADEAYDRLLAGAAFQIAESLRSEGGRLAVEPPVSAFETLALSTNDRIFYKVVDPSGDLLTGDRDLALPPSSAEAATPRFTDTVHRGMDVRLVTLSRRISDPVQPGNVVIAVAQTREARNELARGLTGQALTMVLAVSVVALASAFLAVRFALRPLANIEQAIQARDPLDVTPLAVEAPEEVEALLAAINRFMGRLSERLDVMKRFIADAAHQLSTPVTALAAQVDLLAAAARDRDAPQVERLRERIGELGRLTHQLLNHAMIIHRSEAVPLQPVDLAALARSALASAVPLTLGRDVEIALEAGREPIEIAGDPVSLREALVNVIDNALKHGAPGRLVVRVASDGDAARVEVIDDGDGFAPEALASLTRPFQRGAAAGTGSGLGLAIVADVVEAHGGRIVPERRPEGFVMALRFPLTSESRR